MRPHMYCPTCKRMKPWAQVIEDRCARCWMNEAKAARGALSEINGMLIVATLDKQHLFRSVKRTIGKYLRGGFDQETAPPGGGTKAAEPVPRQQETPRGDERSTPEHTAGDAQ